MNLKVLSFDCEMASSFGMPDPKKDPIVIITVAFDDIVKLLSLTNEEFTKRNDSRIIREFIDIIKDYDPDIVTGYNQDCYSSDTDILTEQGFLPISEYVNKKLEVPIATLDENGELIYEVPTEHVKYFYNGKMFHQWGRSIDFLVTPNHNIWARKQKQKKYNFLKPSDLPNYISYRTSPNRYTGNNSPEFFIIPKLDYISPTRKRHYIMKEKQIPFSLWIKFLGYFLAEGWVGEKEVAISQIRTSKYWEEIKNIFELLPFNYWNSNHTFGIASKQLVSILRTFGKDKDRYIPTDIKNLNKSWLEELIRCMVNGDGSWKENGSFQYNSISEQLVDDLQEISFKCGYTSTKSKDKNKSNMWRLSAHKTTEKHAHCSKFGKWKQYSDYVYCVKLQSHKFFTRRNGKIILSGNSFDWPYIKTRADKFKIPLSIGRDNSQLRISQERFSKSVNIIGRLNVDLLKIARRELDEVKSKTLENVSEYLGVLKKEDRVNLPPKLINKYWRDEKHRYLLFEYARADVISTLGVAKKLLPAQIGLSNLIGMPLDELSNKGRGQQVECFITHEAYKNNELIPYKHERGEKYEGAFVLKPQKGLFSSVVDLDFSSLYPSIIIKYNISPDSFVTEYNKEDVNIAPEVGHAFLKKPDSFFRKIMRYLIEERKKMREEMEKFDPESNEYKLLDITQYNFKQVTNAGYGYMAWNGSKLYKRECAEAITSYGRMNIKRGMELAEKDGFDVLAGDSVARDTPIIIKRNNKVEIIPIQDLDQSPKTIWCGKRNVKRPVEIFTENGWSKIINTIRKRSKKDLYRILTRKSFIEVTSDHSLVIDGVETKPSNLKVGDKIDLIPFELPNKYKVDLDLVWLIGFFIAEGSCGKYNTKWGIKYLWKIDNQNIDYLKKSQKILDRFGFSTKILDIHRSSAIYRLVPIGGIKPIFELFSNWCITKTGDKKIPSFILESDLNGKLSFIRGLWDGDGSYGKTGKEVRLDSIDKSIIAGTTKILESLGYDYSLRIRSDKLNVVVLRVLKNPNYNRVGKYNLIKKIEKIEHDDIVYDIETDNHHFCGGIGNILLHNTDSCFITIPNKPLSYIKEKSIVLADKISKELGLHIKADDYFKTILFTGMKKRYCALTENNKTIVKGLEVRRGDWSDISKETQTKIIEIILREQNPEKAYQYVKSIIKKLKNYKIPLQSLIIQKTLTREPHKYTTKQAHVIAAEIASYNGIEYAVSSKIPYIIYKGKGKISNRVLPTDLIDKFKDNIAYVNSEQYPLDVKYYVEKQILPSSLRILELFDYTANDFEDTKQSTLEF